MGKNRKDTVCALDTEPPWPLNSSPKINVQSFLLEITYRPLFSEKVFLHFTGIFDSFYLFRYIYENE